LGFLDVFAGSSLDAILHRARKSMATGDFDEALKAVERGLSKYPDAQALREVGLSIRRAQAYAGMQGLKDRIAEKGDADAYEQLIALYRDVGMQDEVQRLTERYAAAHPELEAPHLLRGEHALEAFFGDLRASDGRAAIDHLVRAGSLHPDSLKPRMLLAEVYFAIGADRALLGQAAAMERLAGDDVVLQPTLAAIRDAARPAATESVDALLAKVEVSGELLRDPSGWSGRRRRGIASDSDVDRVQKGLDRLVREGTADEAVAIDRAGATVATCGGPAAPPPPADGEAAPEPKTTGLAGVARAVARTIKTQARELEMGSFRRFVVEGAFGVMVVSDAAGGVVAAKARRGADPLRVAERMSVALDGVRGRRAS
jgi:hypothetical protein